MLGWVAAVMAMVSPSQPRPAVIQRTSISAIDDPAIDDPIFLSGKGRLVIVYQCGWVAGQDRQIPDAFYPVFGLRRPPRRDRARSARRPGSQSSKCEQYSCSPQRT